MRIEVHKRNKNVRFKDIRIGGLFETLTATVVMMRIEEAEEGYNYVHMDSGYLGSLPLLTDVIALEQVEPLKVREI